MDLTKVPNDKKLNLCRWYFRSKSTTNTFLFSDITTLFQLGLHVYPLFGW